MSEKVLVAGPWVGEFGWELFTWQGYIRSLSEKFDKTIVLSRPSSKFLYTDFCDIFIDAHPPDGIADSYFMHGLDVAGFFKNILKENNIKLEKGVSILLPRRVGTPPWTHYSENISFGNLQASPKYIKFGNSREQEYNYIFHIRQRGFRKEDNWPIENWRTLFSYLSKGGNIKIACIGTKNSAGWIEGTVDLREENLQVSLDALRNADCTFGPSSGPMHLASLCGCPHLVWGDRTKSLTRYEKNWNPLDTKVLFLGEKQYHPTPEYIHGKFLEWRGNG